MNNQREWTKLGAVAPKNLVDARQELHWAVQPVAALGHTLISRRADWSHYTLDWSENLGALIGKPVTALGSLRAGVRPADLTLFVVDGGGRVVDELPLAGETLRHAYDWLAETLAEHTGEPVPPLEAPPHEMPEHPIGIGQPFATPERAALEELGQWFATGGRALRDFARTAPEASPLRIWPHHFDIAILLVLDPDKGSEEGRTIGLGMTPGDGSYAEPYFYVTPWPPPKAARPGELAAGAWHDEGWFGAVLLGTRVAARSSIEGQAELVASFLSSAARASRTLLEPTG